MACPYCGCKVHYQCTDGDAYAAADDEDHERCAACGEDFYLDDAADEDDDYEDEPRERQDFGCCFPGECCMPGLHFRSECHTAAMYEAAHPLVCDPKPVPNIEDMKP